MNPKTLHVIGGIFLFLGLLWMFLPHLAHGTVLKTAHISIEEETKENFDFHHFLDILLGLNVVFTGLIFIVYSEQKKKSNNL
jgi:hypothetical protein